MWLTLRDPMDCSTPSLPVPHHLPEFAQVHVHWVGDAIQLSHPLSPSSPLKVVIYITVRGKKERMVMYMLLLLLLLLLSCFSHV